MQTRTGGKLPGFPASRALVTLGGGVLQNPGDLMTERGVQVCLGTCVLKSVRGSGTRLCLVLQVSIGGRLPLLVATPSLAPREGTAGFWATSHKWHTELFVFFPSICFVLFFERRAAWK